ncbi:MAG TPA: anti-sigma factor [Rubrobacter sp.]|nr:anti-sigma factor [Rubrobacter sp.]
MSEMNHERFDDLKGAYVLDALPEDEKRSFEEYLAANPERQAEIDELGAVAGLLAFSPQEQEPPPELRRRVMDVVEAEAAPRRPGRRPLFARIGDYIGARNLALGAAVVLVIGLLSWNVLLQDKVRDLRGEIQDTQVQQSRTIELQGSWAEKGAHAEVVSIDKNHVVLMAKNMPSVPDNRMCQIWLIHDGVPEPSGLFHPDRKMTAAAITRSMQKADAIAVTVEPARGSKKPTGDPVLITEL